MGCFVLSVKEIWKTQGVPDSRHHSATEVNMRSRANKYHKRPCSELHLFLYNIYRILDGFEKLSRIVMSKNLF